MPEVVAAMDEEPECRLSLGSLSWLQAAPSTAVGIGP